MSTAVAPTAIGPEAYKSWRTTSLGAVTEAIEQSLILELMGDLRGARVLDAGCGDGVLACVAASRGALVMGIDPDPAMLDAARARAERAGVKADFTDGRIERFPFADASFEVAAQVGATWTTDAPFRETADAIAIAHKEGILAVEMEAAAPYAFAMARQKPVLCFSHVTNQMGRVEGDFEKGVQDGADASLEVITHIARSWLGAAWP